MEDGIINRVAQSKLQIFDLEDYHTEGKRIGINIAPWLWEELILKEKEFREALKNHDWTAYQEAYVYLYCSTDAIIPGWAYSLVTMHLMPFARKVVLGQADELEYQLYEQALSQVDFSVFKDKPVLLKGCSDKAVPAGAYVLACQYLFPVAKSVMYGEACSTVPLYKQKK